MTIQRCSCCVTGEEERERQPPRTGINLHGRSERHVLAVLRHFSLAVSFKPSPRRCASSLRSRSSDRCGSLALQRENIVARPNAYFCRTHKIFHRLEIEPRSCIAW